MNIEQILEFNGFAAILAELSIDTVTRTIDDWQKEYDGEHAILKRADKYKGEGTARELVKVAKEVITLQKKIVGAAISFLFGEPPTLILNDGDEDSFKLLTDTWKDTKLDYFNRRIARRVFIETKAAELWYVTGEEKKIKVMLLCKKTGNDIFAHFNDEGDMDAFTRKYSLKDEKGKVKQHADVYTADKIIKAVKIGGKWDATNEVDNAFGKIPVIYYSQEEPEWNDVQTEIDRMEMLVSSFADTNDYFGSPIIKLKGEIENAPTKEEVGKVLKFKGETNDKGITTFPGDAEYLTWEQAPEAIELEYKMVKDIIYSMTSTPDLSFENVKGMSNLSGIAIKLMFADSLFKAKDKEELFGECLTRRVNLLKAILSTTGIKNAAGLSELDVSVEFKCVLPTDVEEFIKSLSLARGGESIMSEETAVSQNPLVTDAASDIEKMREEKEQQNSLGESYEV